MKKIIGILGVVIIALTISFNSNLINNSNSDLDLENLLTMNVASAQEGSPNGICSTYCKPSYNTNCVVYSTGWAITCYYMRAK